MVAMSYQASTGFFVANWAYLKIRALAIVAFSHVSYTRKEINPLLHPTRHVSHHLLESSFIHGICEFTIDTTNFCIRAVLIVRCAVEFTLLTRLRYRTFPGSVHLRRLAYLAMSKVKEGARDPASIENVKTARSVHFYVKLFAISFFTFPIFLGFYGNREPLHCDRNQLKKARRKEQLYRQRGRQVQSIRREFTLSATLVQQRRAGNSENVIPGAKKRERERLTSQKESRCKLGLSGSRLQLEDKSFPRDSCAFGSGTRDAQVGLDGGRLRERWLRELEGSERDEPNCEITGSLGFYRYPKDLCLRGLRNGCKWCPRREWSSPPDAQRAATDARRGVLYSSVFLGSPGKSSSLHLELLVRFSNRLLFFYEAEVTK
ncbi:hypothetical protein ALC62_07268 [Cyphomyrmex costatus]|uniref:Uncharacterized protein n=1 Tax=Cyphomyrmex costatus TaxID=456900 RepID=A0A195CMR0_9HYME|nr:hypothetical protein ALC62_07268 [Cyphomyrmex costatus]